MSRPPQAGRPARGAPWTPAEDACLRGLYPCYDRMLAALPHRSLAALKRRASHLNIVRRRHVWTNREVQRLRAAFSDHVPDRELEQLFPGLRLGQIKAKAGHLKAPPRRGPLVVFRSPALDDIRARARVLGISHVELDRRARTGRFFQTSSRRPALKPISLAAAYLGGEVAIVWNDGEC